jgi:glycosyltransferase involved in cell wall biosynthesis
MQETPALSVVIVGRNEGDRLVRCLESVIAARPAADAWEIIYADSASTDGSVDRAAQLGARVISVSSDRPRAAVGRNAGWRAARGSIVLFLDGDMTVMPQFVERAIGGFSNAKVGVLFGDCRECNPQGSIYNRILDLDWIAPVGPVEYCGGAALIRRDLLERVGGYNETLIAAEDTELCSRIRAAGFTILHVDQLMVHHDLAITRFSQYWRRAIRSGYAYGEVSKQVRRSDLPIWYRQAQRTNLHGAGMAALIIAAPIISIVNHSLLPLLIVVILIAALASRTAIRSQWKHAPLSTRLLHGLHSHLVQIPLFLGQLKFRRDRLTGRRAELIEYKDKPLSTARKVRSAQ